LRPGAIITLFLKHTHPIKQAQKPELKEKQAEKETKNIKQKKEKPAPKPGKKQKV